MTTYRDKLPYNIESPQRLYIQYAADINFDYSKGEQPSGEESTWIWETNYIPVEHYVNGKLVGRHEWIRIKVGEKGLWSYPIRVSANITNIDAITSEIESSDTEFLFKIILTFSDGSQIESNSITMRNGEDGTKIVSAQVNVDGYLIMTYSDGTVINAGNVKGSDGEGIPVPQDDNWILSQSGGVALWVDPYQVLGNMINQITPIEYDVLTGTLSHSNNSGYKHVPSGGSNGQILSTNGSDVYSWIDFPTYGLDEVIVQDNVLYGNRSILANNNTLSLEKTVGGLTFLLDFGVSSTSLKHISAGLDTSGFMLNGITLELFLTNTLAQTQKIAYYNINGIEITDEIGNIGLVYASDYSANYTLRSLVDVEYVTNYITNLGVTLTSISNWDAAYSWGDHSLIGYLTVETDPIFTASDAASITATDITNWNTAYSREDPANIEYSLEVAISPLDTDINTSTKLATFPIPENMEFVRAFITVDLAPVGLASIFDFYIGGVSVLSTKITIEDGELTSKDAVSQPVFSTTIAVEGVQAKVTCTQTGLSQKPQNAVLTIIYKKN